jgi:Transposase DDE domain
MIHGCHSNHYDRSMPKTPYVFRYRIHNWHAYNRALINRGRLTVWFDENAIVAWRNMDPRHGPGAPRIYSDLAIECSLVLKSVYHLSLRAAQGLVASVIDMLKLTLPVPDYSTVSRQQGTLSVCMPVTPRSCPRHVVIDSTGLKVYGAGEWHIWKHRVSRRRTWRKLHLGVDEKTKEIIAVELTESRVHDSQRLPPLLEQIPGPVGQVSGDGAYDTRACYEAVLQRGATPIFIPRRTARPRVTPDPTGWRVARDRTLQQVKARGRYGWRIVSGVTRQSIAENAMFRFKTLCGGRLWARSLVTQRTEALVKCAVLNRMTQLGMPEALRVE